MEPKISIVFTSYNHRPFLKQAVDSLLAQTFQDFELIIIDDCSTDGSQEVLKNYTDPRIRLILKDENGGSYVLSTNYGASFAIAPFIIFAQCDDWAEPTQLEKLFNAMQTHDVGVVYSSSKLVDENGTLMRNDFEVRERKFRMKYSKDSIIPKQEATEYFLHSCIIPNLSAALVKRNLFEKLGGLSSDYLVLADWDFWLRMTQEADFYYIREPLNNFRQHSTTIRSSIKMKRQISEIFKMIFSFAASTGMSKNTSCHIAATLWIRWAETSIGSWLRSFPDLLSLGTRYSCYFPIATAIEFVKTPCSKLFHYE